MGKKDKKFDCLKMKDEIQAKMMDEFAGLTEEERRQRIREELETSNDPLAKKWRSMSNPQREDHAA